MFPNAGSACVVNGHAISRHGDVQHRPWSWNVRGASPEQVEIEFATASHDLPFGIHRTVALVGGSEVQINETITNLSHTCLPYLRGHHITFGAAMMRPSGRIELPDVVEVFAEAADNPSTLYALGARGPLNAMPSRDGGTVDLTRFPDQPFSTMLFADHLPEHRYGIWSNELETGVAVEWDGDAFPALWIWATGNGAPTQADLVACALEPQAAAIHTLSEAVAAGAAPSLAGGASRTAWLWARVHHGRDDAKTTTRNAHVA